MKFDTMVEPSPSAAKQAPVQDVDTGCAACSPSSRPALPLSSRLVLCSHLLYFGGGGVVLIVDQLTKAWIVRNLPAYHSIDLFEWLAPILSFTSVRNTGVAFGLFQGLGMPFALLSVVIVGAILAFRRTVPLDELWVHGALGLVTGGAIGNVVDRIARGYVVDFLDVNFWPLHNWPVFNLADAAIVVGVGVLLLDSFLADWRARRGND